MVKLWSRVEASQTQALQTFQRNRSLGGMGDQAQMKRQIRPDDDGSTGFQQLPVAHKVPEPRAEPECKGGIHMGVVWVCRQRNASACGGIRCGGLASGRRGAPIALGSRIKRDSRLRPLDAGWTGGVKRSKCGPVSLDFIWVPDYLGTDRQPRV